MTDQALEGALEVREPTEAEQLEKQRLSAVNVFIERLKPHMADVLPRAGVTPERLIRLMYADIRKNPQLLNATQASLLGAMLTTIQLGLEPGGSNGECWIVPFRNKGRMEAQFMLGYKGMVKLFWNHPLAKDIDAATVYEGDDFHYEYGTNKQLRHTPTRPSERGEIRCYYAQAHLHGGGAPFEVLYPEEVESFRLRSNSPNSPAWKSDYEPMAHKTCVRQLFTFLPKSVELSRAVARDGEVRTDLTVDALDAPPQTPEERPQEDSPEAVDADAAAAASDDSGPSEGS